ncbi:MAG: IS605 OrfB family transposase [Natronomonas sp.]
MGEIVGGFRPVDGQEDLSGVVGETPVVLHQRADFRLDRAGDRFALFPRRAVEGGRTGHDAVPLRRPLERFLGGPPAPQKDLGAGILNGRVGQLGPLERVEFAIVAEGRALPEAVDHLEALVVPAGDTFGIPLLTERRVDSLDASNSVGIDLGILNYIHTSDGKTVDWLNLEDEYERLRHEQRKLSRKEKGSNNYEKQRLKVAKVKRHIKRKVLDYQHKITTWLVREYDAVFVEDLDVKGMLEQSYNTRNKQDAAWRQFIQLLEYKAEVYGTHVVQVEARDTTKECASCGVETAKPIWGREHSCPGCGFKTDRDANAAMNVLQRGFSELGLGCPEDTPVETVAATDTTHFESVSASHVVETGSPGDPGAIHTP